MGISIQDIYIRDEQDPSYRDDIITYSDELEQTISMIKMILTTRQGSVLGDTEFGVSIEDQVFSMNVPLSEIESQIRQQISTYVLIVNPSYDIGVNASYVRGKTRDVVYIDITINNQKVLGVLVK